MSVLLCAAILFTSFSFAVSAQSIGTTYYVDSIGGSDSNSGTSESDAWKTLVKADSFTYSAGDEILFKCDGVFEGTFSAKGSGISGGEITLGSYASGEKPLLITQDAATVVTLQDVSYWTVENLEITAPNGNGILVYYYDKVVSGINIKNVSMHDIRNTFSDTYHSGERAALRIMGSSHTSGTHAANIYVYGCEIYDCGYGIFTGSNFPDTEEHPYNKNIVVDSCSIHDLYDDAFIMSDTDGIVLKNSTVINACQSSGVYFTAPVWLWGVENGLVENCEIAGAKNVLDGMAVDFDDHTNNSLMQYIYSHDNTRFMINCPCESGHKYNTVRYCLSVNDSRGNSKGGSGSGEYYFKFYNNTIVNGADFDFTGTYESFIQNNIFSLVPGYRVKFDKDNNCTLGNNCYYGCLKPLQDFGSIHRNPQFSGTDLTDKNSFILKSCSPCIGAGVQVEEDMGEHDFYGNALTGTHNIGCYEGDGVDGSYTYEDPVNLICKIVTGIYTAIYNQAKHDWKWFKDLIGING